MKTLLRLLTLTFFLLATPLTWAQIPPTQYSQGISYITGGVGDEESSAILAEAKQWPLLLELSQLENGRGVWIFGSQIKILNAQKLLPQVSIDYDLRVKISQVCSELDVDGLRGDIVTNRASRAYAAYEGRLAVTSSDIKSVITMCLRHRLRKDPLETIDSGDKVLKTFIKVFG